MRSIAKKLLKKDISTWRNYEGAWVCQANGFLSHRYYYFTKREAVDDYYHRCNA